MMEKVLKVLAQQRPQEYKNLEDMLNNLLEGLDQYFMGPVSDVIWQVVGTQAKVENIESFKKARRGFMLKAKMKVEAFKYILAGYGGLTAGEISQKIFDEVFSNKIIQDIIRVLKYMTKKRAESAERRWLESRSSRGLFLSRGIRLISKAVLNFINDADELNKLFDNTVEELLGELNEEK